MHFSMERRFFTTLQLRGGTRWPLAVLLLETEFGTAAALGTTKSTMTKHTQSFMRSDPSIIGESRGAVHSRASHSVSKGARTTCLAHRCSWPKCRVAPEGSQASTREEHDGASGFFASWPHAGARRADVSAVGSSSRPGAGGIPAATAPTASRSRTMRARPSWSPGDGSGIAGSRNDELRDPCEGGRPHGTGKPVPCVVL